MVNKAGEQLDPSERYEATKKRLKDWKKQPSNLIRIKNFVKSALINHVVDIFSLDGFTIEITGYVWENRKDCFEKKMKLFYS